MVSFDLKREIHEAILDWLPKLTYWLMIQLCLSAVAYSTYVCFSFLSASKMLLHILRIYYNDTFFSFIVTCSRTMTYIVGLSILPLVILLSIFFHCISLFLFVCFLSCAVLLVSFKVFLRIFKK